MRSANSSFLKLSMMTLALVMVAALGLAARGQDASKPTPYIDDWTHHHLVFSNPGTQADAVKNGKLEEWKKITGNPRYQMQQSKQSNSQRRVMVDWDPGTDWAWQEHWGQRPGRNKPVPSASGMKKDWNEVLGGGASGVSTVAAPTSSNITGGTSYIRIGTTTVYQTFTASAPVQESGNVQMGTIPADGTSFSIGRITYAFSSSTLSASQATDTCTISVASGFRSTTTDYLYMAMGGTGGSSSSTTTWECNSSVATDRQFTATGDSTSSHYVTISAKIAGSTGYTAFANGSPSAGFSYTAGTAASDGTQGANNFTYWSGTTYVSAAQLATNIATAVNANTTTNALIKATANIPQSGQITFTRLLNTPTTNTYSDTISSFTAFTGTWSLAYTGVLQAMVQPNAAPAMYGPSLDVASCANDFVVYPTGQAGSSTAATIVAYNNMYVGTGGCETTDPTVYWAYNTNAGYYATTSPVLSFDGTQVAFIESNGTTAELVLLKWAASTTSSFASPATPALESSGTNYRSYSGGACMYRMAFSGSYDDSTSAPYYDYTGDAIYVGDDSGHLHKFTGVFYGSPAEVTSGGFPTTTTGSTALSSPVYEFNSGRVFVGNAGGVLYSVPASNGSSGTIYNTGSLGDAIADAPLVDGTAGTVYVFEGRSTQSYTSYNALYQFTTGFTAYGTPGVVALSSAATAGTGYYLYSGMFDNAYYISSNHTGNLWVVGNAGVAAGANLYRVPINNNSLGTPALAASALSAGGQYSWPSPLTEFYNTGKDYVYFSVNRGATTILGTTTGCTNTAGNGCIIGINITTAASPTLAGAQNLKTPGINGCWATGTTVIDNDDTNTTGASQIYFIGLNGAAAGGPNGNTSSNCTGSAAQTINAIQASQSNP